MNFDNALQILPAVLILASAVLMLFSKPCDTRGDMCPQFIVCLSVLFLTIGAALNFYNG